MKEHYDFLAPVLFLERFPKQKRNTEWFIFKNWFFFNCSHLIFLENSNTPTSILLSTHSLHYPHPAPTHGPYLSHRKLCWMILHRRGIFFILWASLIHTFFQKHWNRRNIGVQCHTLNPIRLKSYDLIERSEVNESFLFKLNANKTFNFSQEL